MGINAGVNVYHSTSGSYSDTNVSPLLGANFMYSNSKLLIRLNYITSVQNPSLSEQQDFGRFTDSLIYQHGNPRLSNALNHKVTAMMNFMRDFTISCEYNYTHNAIFDIAGLGNGLRPDGMDGYYVAYQYQNGKSSSVKANITYTKSFNFGLTVSATGSISREKATYREFSMTKTQPYYDWYVMYNFKGLDLRCYLSSYLSSEFYVSPQGLGWERNDIHAISFVKNLNKDRIQLVAMWYMPFHFLKKGYENTTTAPVYNEKRFRDYRSWDNALAFTFVWRFNGGKKTKTYNRQIESVAM